MSKAAEYRRLAHDCLEVAQRLSLQSDRKRLLDTASRWIELAAKAEAEERGGQG